MDKEITVELVGGPLDGERLTYTLQELGEDATQWGAYMMVDGHKCHPEDPGARAVYEPVPGGVCTRWVFDGWVPW